MTANDDANLPVELAGKVLPLQTGETLSGGIRILCVGPNDWLLLSDAVDMASIRRSIDAECESQGVAIVDMSHALATVRVEGSAAVEVLSKGCGLDLHQNQFPAGRGARTRFASISVILECLDHSPLFELHVAPSYVAYLRDWLVDAAAEFDAIHVPPCSKALSSVNFSAARNLYWKQLE
jgi:sarcosine oxidase subunit gamma